jgi:hypothetical protein
MAARKKQKLIETINDLYYVFAVPVQNVKNAV